jgi:hypothetical protein
MAESSGRGSQRGVAAVTEEEAGVAAAARRPEGT